MGAFWACQRDKRIAGCMFTCLIGLCQERVLPAFLQWYNLKDAIAAYACDAGAKEWKREEWGALELWLCIQLCFTEYYYTCKIFVVKSSVWTRPTGYKCVFIWCHDCHLWNTNYMYTHSGEESKNNRAGVDMTSLTRLIMKINLGVASGVQTLWFTPPFYVRHLLSDFVDVHAVPVVFPGAGMKL